MGSFETSRTKVVARPAREGGTARQDGGHAVYKHADLPGRIVVPRHRELSMGVARAIAKTAGWI